LPLGNGTGGLFSRSAAIGSTRSNLRPLKQRRRSVGCPSLCPSIQFRASIRGRNP
jgi:hypothetical protein